MKLVERWHSSRVHSDVTVARWGHFGRPVIVFPTAGGDAEEIERMRLVDACGELLEAGRVKLYSCDSVAGAVLLRGDGAPGHRAALLNAFHGFVREELVPAIRLDCQSPDITVMTTGASIGAFNALAFSNSFGSFSDTLGSTVVATPAGRGGSGFSGGSSGGGGGGGGGGSW